MDNSSMEPRSLIIYTKLYEALLAIYPSEFRRAYGAPMLQVFRDCSRRALHDSGTTGMLTLWMRTLLDTVQTALEEHTQRGVEMSKSKFIKLSGWAFILGSLSMLLGWLASSRPAYDRFNAASLPIDRYANAVDDPLSVIAMFLLAVGSIGLFLRYGQSASRFGRLCLGISAVSGIISFIGSIGLAIYDQEPWWSIFFMGLVFEFLGLALFGLVNLGQRILPRWNALPLLAGIWIPLYVIASLIVEQGSGNWVDFPPAVDIIMWLLTTAGLFGLGYLLQSDPQPNSATAMAV